MKLKAPSLKVPLGVEKHEHIKKGKERVGVEDDGLNFKKV